jgi:diguanylate cyclase (GGDEF)-like protein/PAS domain S-box-containing protein
MEAILDNIDAFIFIKDAGRIYRYANLPLESLYGFQRDHIIGKDDSAFHSGESLQALWRNDEAVLASNRPIVAEEQVFDHDGHEGWYMSRKMPIELPGFGRCLLGMATDITQYKLAMAGLSRSELKFRSLFEASLDAVGVIDSEGVIREINDAALLMFGCADRDYFLTLKPEDLSPALQPDGRPSALVAAEHIARAMELGRHEFEWIHQRLDTGEEFLAQVSMNRIELEGLPAILTRERDISAQRAYEQNLRHLAFTDQLTGLANFRAVTDWLTSHLDSGLNAAVLALGFDIDDFHKYNQVYGRSLGDEMLVAFSSTLKEVLTGHFIAARLQADEFLVVLVLDLDIPDESSLRDHAERIVLHLRSSLMALLRHQIQLRHVPTFSVGATGLLQSRGSQHQDVADDLLTQVNAALKHASRRGSGQYEYFHPSLLSSARRDVMIETELTTAIASGRLCLHYQPIVSREGLIVAAEALIRYRMVDGGLVYPGQFIQIAEQKGHITPMGQYLLDAACEQLSAWRRAGLPIHYLSLNLSPAQLRDGGALFVDFLLGVVRRHGIEPSWIQLEITETAVLGDLGPVDDVLCGLARKGFMLAIDDFGTGYSSLSVLQRLPFTTLKIDQSFVQGMSRDSKRRDLVQACLSIAANLRLRCVAEGVDSESDCEALMALKCDYFQGFLFDPALDAALFERRLLDQQQANPLSVA